MIIQIDDPNDFKQKALQWASGFDVFCYLDSNNFSDPYSKFDLILAVGVEDELIAKTGTAFAELAKFREKHPGWITGYFTYDLKNEVEKLTSLNMDRLGFPDLYFFAPQHLILLKNGNAEIISDNPQEVFDCIQSHLVFTKYPAYEIRLSSRFSKEEYMETVIKIREHISRGDIYVTNFCQEFFAEQVRIDPLAVFRKLNTISPNPFSAFFRRKECAILSASPERFLAKRGNKLISQPIKGTSKRYDDAAKDQKSKELLRQTSKELQENVMIVDLVRNDLTKFAKAGTVTTEELFGIYSFKQVHQMMSTVVCELKDGISDLDAIKNAFPMGSMTGAPKVSAMQLMEQFERSKRGVYSGAIGYFGLDGDFDFNVVIRTLIYNAENAYLSFQAGGAITYHSEPELEYEECLLKARAILEVLGQ